MNNTAAPTALQLVTEARRLRRVGGATVAVSPLASFQAQCTTAGANADSELAALIDAAVAGKLATMTATGCHAQISTVSAHRPVAGQ